MLCICARFTGKLVNLLRLNLYGYYKLPSLKNVLWSGFGRDLFIFTKSDLVYYYCQKYDCNDFGEIISQLLNIRKKVIDYLEPLYAFCK